MLADKNIMLCIRPGEHGRCILSSALPIAACNCLFWCAKCILIISYRNPIADSTFGGNPLASAVAIAALDVIKDEGLVERYRISQLPAH